jgi:hypothetical protein
VKSPEGFAKAPPEPSVVRRRGARIRESEDSERDARQALYMEQLGGDGREMNRIRVRERMQPGYTETQARQLDDDRETLYRTRKAGNARLLKRSEEFYAKPAEQPAEPVGTPTTAAPQPMAPVTGRIQSAARQDDGRGFSGGDAGAKRRRVAPQRLTRALGGGDLSRLLGA